MKSYQQSSKVQSSSEKNDCRNQRTQITDNRLSAQRQLNTLHAIQSECRAPMQFTTDIDYHTGVLNYWCGGLNWGVQTVGVEMEAYLDPADAKTGSRTAAGVGIYANGNYPNIVQGHLLNANLGGQAISENLFPITSEMNRAHSTQVEDALKAQFLRINNNRANLLGWNNRRLYYHLTVNHAANISPVTLRNTSFNVTAYITDNNNPALHGGVNRDPAEGGINNLQINTPGPSLNDQLAAIGFTPDAAPSYTLDPTVNVDPATGNNFQYLQDATGTVDNSLRVFT